MSDATTTLAGVSFHRFGCGHNDSALSVSPGRAETWLALHVTEVGAVQNLDEVLSSRVDELLHARGREGILSTTGTQAAIASLNERVMVLEEAVRQLAAALEVAERTDATTDTVV